MKINDDLFLGFKNPQKHFIWREWNDFFQIQEFRWIQWKRMCYKSRRRECICVFVGVVTGGWGILCDFLVSLLRSLEFCFVGQPSCGLHSVFGSLVIICVCFFMHWRDGQMHLGWPKYKSNLGKSSSHDHTCEEYFVIVQIPQRQIVMSGDPPWYVAALLGVWLSPHRDVFLFREFLHDLSGPSPPVWEKQKHRLRIYWVATSFHQFTWE